jgi:hypothetical protein
MMATEALALHLDVQAQQQNLIAALGSDDADMENCLELSHHITELLETIPPANELQNMTAPLREELLKASRITAHLLQRYQQAVVNLRQQHTNSQIRAERDSVAIRNYHTSSQRSTAAESPRFLDEKR